MWGQDDDDGVVKIFDDEAKATGQKENFSKESLLFAPVLRAWISTTREITAGDAFRFWTRVGKKWGGSQLLVGRDVGVEVGMLVVPSRYATDSLKLDAGDFCGELQDAQDAGISSICYVKWISSGIRSGPYSVPNRWLEESNASSFQLAVPTDAEIEKSTDYTNEMEYEKSMAEARRTQLISKWGRLSEKALFGLEVLVRRTLWDKRVDKEEVDAVKRRVRVLEKEQEQLQEQMKQKEQLDNGKDTEEYKQMAKRMRSIKKSQSRAPKNPDDRTLAAANPDNRTQAAKERRVERDKVASLNKIRRISSGEIEEDDSESSDEERRRTPGYGMKVMIPRLRRQLPRRKAIPPPGPFPQDICCRLLEQNELFCLPSICQKMITSDHKRAACVLLLCSHRATSPSGLHKAFPLSKVLEARKCCVLIVRDCTDPSQLSRFLDEFTATLDETYYEAIDIAKNPESSGMGSRAASRLSSRQVFSRASSQRKRLNPISRLTSNISRLSTSEARTIQPPKAPWAIHNDDLFSTWKMASTQSTSGNSAGLSEEGWGGGKDEARGQGVAEQSVEDDSYDVEMLLLQRIDLVKLKGVRKLLTLLQHEACAIESLICIHTEWGDEGARLLGKAMQGKRTCEEGSVTPIPGVTRGWQDMTHEDRMHGGRTDLGISTLVMQQCGISEKGATSIGEALIGNHTIKLLDVSGNRTGRRGIQALSFGLGHSLSLQYLGVHGNSVGVEEIKFLENAVFDRWQTIQEMERQRAEHEAIRKRLAEAALAAAQEEAAATGETDPSKNLDAPPASDDVLPIERKPFKLVTGSMDKPVVVQMIPPPEDDHDHGHIQSKPIKGMKRMKDLPRWTPFDKKWLGIMEWQVKQRGWEEGRRGWSLENPEKKQQLIEQREMEQREEEVRLADMRRRKQLLDEQMWVDQAEAEGYQFLSFEKGQGDAGMLASGMSLVSPMGSLNRRPESLPVGTQGSNWRPESSPLGSPLPNQRPESSPVGPRRSLSPIDSSNQRPESPMGVHSKPADSPLGFRASARGRTQSRAQTKLESPMSVENQLPQSPMDLPVDAMVVSHTRPEMSPFSRAGLRAQSPIPSRGMTSGRLPSTGSISGDSPVDAMVVSHTRPEMSPFSRAGLRAQSPIPSRGASVTSDRLPSTGSIRRDDTGSAAPQANAEAVPESPPLPEPMASSEMSSVPAETTRETISTELTRDTLLSAKDTTLGGQSESVEFWMPEGSLSFEVTAGMKP